MKCRFCGYTYGWVWEDDAYVASLGEHGDFYRFLADQYNPVTGNQNHSVVMCPHPECQRTQLEE